MTVDPAGGLVDIHVGSVRGEMGMIRADGSFAGGSFRIGRLLALALSGALFLQLGCANPFQATEMESEFASSKLNTIVDTSEKGARIGGSCINGIPVFIYGEGVQAPSEALCHYGSFTSYVTFSEGDGLKTIYVTQQTGSGSITTARNFRKDTTAPVVKILAPNSGAAFQSHLPIAGLCEKRLPVEISGAGLQAPAVLECSDRGTFLLTLSMSEAEGSKEIVVRQTDSAGNVGVAEVAVDRDMTSPELAVSEPLSGAYVGTGPVFKGSCEDGLNVESTQGSDIMSPVSVACSGGRFSMTVTLTEEDGPKKVVLRQIDRAGNSSVVERTLMRNTVPPKVMITAPAAGTFARDGVMLAGSCKAGLDVLLNGAGLAAPMSVKCPEGTFSANAAFSAGDGVKAITASQTDLGGLTGSDTRSFTRDTVAPVLSLAQPAENAAVRETVVVAGSCETGLSVVLGGTGPAQAGSIGCVNGAFASTIALSAGDGAKELLFAQTDAAGNRGQIRRVVMKDTTAPIIKITAPAAGTATETGLQISGSCESGLTVTASGDGLAAPVSSTCSSGAFSLGITLSQTSGQKNVTVSQRDAAGNTGSDTRSFVKLATTPMVAITAPNASTAAQVGLTVSGTCQPGVNVQLSGTGLASAVTTTCASGTFSAPITFSNGDGSKNVIATQVNSFNETGTDSRSFIKDTVAPMIAIIEPSENTALQSTVLLKASCEAGLAVVIGGSGLSQGQTVNCSSAGLLSATLALSSGDGEKIITLTQTDAAQNRTSVSRKVIRDTTAPALTIASPAAGTSAQAGVTLTGVCESGLEVRVTGTGVSAAISGACTSGGYSIPILFSAGDGTKSITVSQTDAAGNPASVVRSFNRLTVAPMIAISAPAANTAAQTGVTLSGTCQTGLNIQLSGSGLASPSSTTCPSGTFSVAITFSANDGVKNVIVSQTDAAGNTGSDTRSFSRDTVKPIVTVAAPSENSFVQAAATFSGSCESGLPVTFWGTGVAQQSTAACSSGVYSATITLSTGEGVKDVSVSQTDAAQNFTTVIRKVTKDTVAPALSITSPPAGTISDKGLTVMGACEANLAVEISGSGVLSPVSQTCSSTGSYSIAILFSSGDGVKTAVVTQRDLAGNQARVTRDFMRTTAIDGASLYTANCAGCHGALSSSTKRGRSAQQIQDAINTISSMNSLKFLTAAEVDAISKALAVTTDAPKLEVSAYTPTIGTRFHMESALTSIFVASSSPTTDDTNIQTRIRNLVGNKAGAIGGACSRYDSCAGNESQHETNVQAQSLPQSQAMRKGYIVRACEEVLSLNDKAVVNALSRAGLTTASAVNATNVNRMFEVFYPGKIPTSEVTTALVGIGMDAASRSYTAVDQWRLTILPLCSSAQLDLL
jgi:hypothetical protein